MTTDRLRDYLERMHAAALQVQIFASDISEDRFMTDVRTQMAIGMAFVLIGEAAARIMSHYPDFPVDHPEIPWSNIKGMRNIVVHDYYEIELPLVWKTVRSDIPSLISDLQALRHWRAQGE